MTTMRTILPLFVALSGVSAFAQEPVLIAGGSTPATPVAALASTPVGGLPQPIPVVPVVYVMPVAYAQPACASGVSGGSYGSGNVLYIGGPDSCYRNIYQGAAYQRGCACPSPNVIYFGRGEVRERGRGFRYYR